MSDDACAPPSWGIALYYALGPACNLNFLLWLRQRRPGATWQYLNADLSLHHCKTSFNSALHDCVRRHRSLKCRFKNSSTLSDRAGKITFQKTFAIGLNLPFIVVFYLHHQEWALKGLYDHRPLLLPSLLQLSREAHLLGLQELNLLIVYRLRILLHY